MSESSKGPIIMVDDEVELVRTTLTRLRKEFGEEHVQGTSDAREAASWIELERPSTLITDLRMPHLTGLELIERAHRRWGHIPTVLITAIPTAQVDEGQRAGTFEYLPKPFSFQSLRDAIYRVAGRPEPLAFRGAVAVTMLADVVQLYALSGRAGELTVESIAGAGSIWIEKGGVVHAEAGSHVGAEAFFEILSWPSGRFQFAPGESPGSSIDLSLNELLLESYRRNDERTAGRPMTAGPEASLSSIDEVFSALENAGPPSGAEAPPVSHADAPPGALFPTTQHKEDVVMANNVKESLAKLESMDGFIGAGLVDSDSGMCLGIVGGGALLNIEVAGAANAEVVRAKRKAVKALNLKDDIEDILITLGKQYHLIRPLKNRPGVFFYVAIDRSRANLAMARFSLTDVEKDIVL